MPFPQPAVALVLLVIVAVAAIFDLRFRRIPNWLNVVGVVLGVGVNVMLFHTGGLATSGLGLGLALLVYMPLYLLRGMGAGDVKLMAAVGAIAGPTNWFYIFLLTCVLGGILAFLLVVWKKRLYVTLQNVASLLSDFIRFQTPHANHPQLDVRHKGSLSLPHGVSIALGSILFLGLGAVL